MLVTRYSHHLFWVAVRWLSALCLVLCTTVHLSRAHAAPNDAARFRASADLSIADLQKLIAEGQPDLETARREVDVAKAQQKQTRLFNNPTVDAAWGTIPIGETAPPNLRQPFQHVPNYTVGVGYTFPLGKRGHRMARADAELKARQAQLSSQTRLAALDLADLLGVLANAQLRIAALRELSQGARAAVDLATESVKAKFGTPLDVDRLSIELARTEQTLSAAQGDLSEALAACSALIARPCEPFVDAESARGYLDHFIHGALVLQGALTDRPDLRVLASSAQASRAEQRLARADAIPDPTLRVSYTHDLLTGNQLNSVGLAVSMPLPLFDHGQARLLAAQAAEQHLVRERERRIESARASLESLAQRVVTQRERCTSMSNETIPRARGVLRDLETAAQQRLIPVTDLIQARRTLSELFVQEADSCSAAYAAVLQVIRTVPQSGVSQ